MKQFPLHTKGLRASGLALLFASGVVACEAEDHVNALAHGSGGAGGGGASVDLLAGGDCDPMVPTHCGFPFPSNVYLVDDPAMPTGKHVAFRATTLPAYSATNHLPPAAFTDRDGFSPGQAPMTHMPGASITGLPTQKSIQISLTTDSPTILLDADTGKLVPHFAELDMSTDADDQRAILIRPVVRLRDATRYIVAIRHVVDKDGKALEPSPVFAALRDGSASDDPTVEPRRELYADILGNLAAAGVDPSDLQIAWDYSTASRENTTGWLLHMRDDALAVVGQDGPPYVVDSIEPAPNADIYQRIHAHMTVPIYLDKPGVGGTLVFDDKGMPKRNGTADYDVLIHVPNSATTGQAAGLVQNGHGLLGDKTEGQDGYLAKIANTLNYVAFGVDLIGMAADDENVIINAIVTDFTKFKNVVGRQHQGILNSLLAMRMMKGGFYKDPNVTFNGVSGIDPTRSFYRGDSQGGIFGVTYMALTTDVTRGLLGEPGMPYNLLLNRSVDFAPFFTLLKGKYHNGLDVQLVLGILQLLWDRTEPDGYAPYINGRLLPGTPSHEILIHAAIGDYQVTPLGAHILARTVGAKNLSPVNRSIWGIDETPGPFTGSGIVEFSFGLPEVPQTNTPPLGPDFPEDGDPHDKVRVLDAAIGQTGQFFTDGVIKPFCSGPCDPQ